jgi:hypothetical protein
MKIVQKIHIAVEQLEDALEAWFNARYHSAIVLAGAAEQLFGGYLMKHGIEPTYAQERRIITKIANSLRSESGEEQTTEKDIGDFLNRGYNHSKHAGKSDHQLQMDAREEAYRVIDRAITNYDQLLASPEYDLPDLPMAQKFRMESLAQIRDE